MVALRSSSSLLDSPHHRTGTPRRGGFRRLCASITMKARGTRTPATGTLEGSSFYSTLGGQWEVVDGQIWLVQESRRFGPFSSISVMDIPGANGAPREPAGCDDSRSVGELLAVVASEASEHPYVGSARQKAAWDEIKRRCDE